MLFHQLRETPEIYARDLWCAYGYKLYEPDPTNGGRFEVDESGRRLAEVEVPPAVPKRWDRRDSVARETWPIPG